MPSEENVAGVESAAASLNETVPGPLTKARFTYMRGEPDYDVQTAYRMHCGKDEFRYIGKVVRWYYSTQAPGPIVYASNGNTVSLSYGARPCMTLPDEFPDDIDYAWYMGKADAMLKDVGYYTLTGVK